jgi:NADPH:quinone reductase-like Zn-dependent oxidoreductase
VLSVAEIEDPHAGPGQVRIAVRAAGVNPVDWKIVGGMMGGSPDAPTVPGFDAAGVVDEVGEGVTDVQVGDAVFGQAVGGSAAEYAVLSAWAPKPDLTSFEMAGGLPGVGETAVHVLDLLGPQPGQTAVVDGAIGGVGIATVQMALARGLRVIGTAGRPTRSSSGHSARCPRCTAPAWSTGCTSWPPPVSPAAWTPPARARSVAHPVRGPHRLPHRGNRRGLITRGPVQDP